MLLGRLMETFNIVQIQRSIGKSLLYMIVVYSNQPAVTHLEVFIPQCLHHLCYHLNSTGLQQREHLPPKRTLHLLN